MQHGADHRSPYAPPLAYAGERQWLVSERNRLQALVKKLPKHSKLKPGISHVLSGIHTRLLVIGETDEPPIPGADRADLK